MQPRWAHLLQREINWALDRKGTFEDMTTHLGWFFPPGTGKEEAGGVDG